MVTLIVASWPLLHHLESKSENCLILTVGTGETFRLLNKPRHLKSTCWKCWACFNRHQVKLAVLSYSHTKQLSVPYPVFDSLGGMSSFLLGIIVLKDINDSHEINLLPGSTCKPKTLWSFVEFPLTKCPAGGALSIVLNYHITNSPLLSLLLMA